MTLTYYSNNIIHGLSSDVKPTTAQDKSVFFETDTGKFYDYSLSTTTWNLRPYGLSNILTTDGDMIVRKDGVSTRIGIGTSGDKLEVSGTDIYWTSQIPVPVKGVFGGGYNPSDSVVNIMDYITIDTTGNATDFGDLSVARKNLAGVSIATRGVFGGGGGYSNVMDYITIGTTGNATDFGDLSSPTGYLAGVSSGTRGVFGSGSTGSLTNAMDYITIATTGNATDFGDLTVARSYLAGVSSTTRGVFGGGYYSGGDSVNIMDYITIATTGNATDFGDLTLIRQKLAGVSSDTRGVFGGGYDSLNNPNSDQQGVNVMDYITIATTGNATDFGDLTVARYQLAGLSG